MIRRPSRRRRAHLEELRRTRAGYDAALVQAGTVLFQQVGRGTDAHHVSASVADLLGRPPEVFLIPGTLRWLVHPDDVAAFNRMVPVGPLAPPAPPSATAATEFTAAPSAEPLRVATEPVVRLLHDDGRWVHVLVRRAPSPPDAPVQGALIDVSVGAAERERSDRFAAMAEASADALLVLAFLDRTDPATLVIRSANARARRLFRLDDQIGRAGGPAEVPLGAVFDNGSAQLLRSALFDVAHTGATLTAERLTFSEVPGTHLDLRVDRLADGTLGLTIVDVSELVAAEERLRHQSTHDAVTGLPNEVLLEERIAAAVAELAGRGTTVLELRDGVPGTASEPLGHPVLHTLEDIAAASTVVGLVAVEVTALGDVNAAHGRAAGDRLLAEVARRLRGAGPDVELVARAGGGQFVLLTQGVRSEDAVLAVAETVRRLLDEPMDLDGHLAPLGAAVGHAIAPDDGEDARALLRAVDASVERARASLLPVAAPATPAAGGVGLLEELRRGLSHRELELRFQPLVELRTGRVTKVEALLRWQREDAGARPPVELLELAERSGLVQPLTRWMLGEAAAASRVLDGPGRRTVVGTNLSLRNLHHGELLSFVELLVRSGELDPQLVELELSETELMDDPMTAREVVGRLRDLGLQVVVDEFGSGYSTAASLAALGVGGVKIDRSFVSTLADVPADVEVVRSTVRAAHELGLSVTAEGVADAASLGLLAELGCDHAQGTHLSAPVPLEDLAARVADLESALAGWVAAAEAT